MSTTPELFTAKGNPVEFFVPADEHNRQELVDTITQNGGKIVEKDDGEAIYLSTSADEARNPVDPKFVLESVEKGEFQDPSDYRSFGVQHIMNYLDKEAAGATDEPVVTESTTADDAAAIAAAETDATEAIEGTGTAAPADSEAAGAPTADADSDAAAAATTATTVDPTSDATGTTDTSAATAAAAAVAAAAAAAISSVDPESREARLAAASAVPNGMFVTREDRINLHNKNGFTQQEDEIILEEVRKHPHRRSTHKLYNEIALKIGRHTGNSIRYRYRTHLAGNLVYVYKVDETDGSLIYDAEGKMIKVSEMPKTLKNKFVAKDDYTLCKDVRAYLNERENATEADPKDIILPGKFFEKIAELYPSHSRAAWRDRYRKFAIPFGIDKYVGYYESELAAGRVPIEMKNFTGRHLYKGTKTKKGEEDGADGDSATGANGDSNIEAVISERLGQHNDQYQEPRQYKKRKNNSGAASAATGASTGSSSRGNASNDAANVFLSGDQNALAGISSNNLFESQAAQAVAVANANHADIDPEDFLTDDLVTSKFFTFQPLSTVVTKVTEIVNRNYESGDAEQLIDALFEEAGVQKKFGTFIITSVCGDVVLIPKYFEQFLKTGQNPPEDVHGVWTPRDDAFLKSNDPEGMEFLRRLHGQKRIELRKNFTETLSDWTE